MYTTEQWLELIACHTDAPYIASGYYDIRYERPGNGFND